MTKTIKSNKRNPKKHKKSSRRHNNGMTKLVMPRGLTTIFPDRYRCSGRICYSNTIQIAGVASTQASYTYMIMGNCITGNTFSINGGGAGPLTVSGVYYLLGDQDKGGGHAGGQAPYVNYRCYGSSIKLQVVPVPVATNAPLVVNLMPLPPDTSQTNVSGFSISNLQEQPLCKHMILPAYLLSKVPMIRHKVGTLRICGDRYGATMENGTFEGNYTTQPGALWNWYINIATLTASALDYSIYAHINFEVVYDLEFHNRVSYVGTAPV